MIEHLDPVATAVGHVDLAVVRSGDPVRGRELLGQRAAHHRLRIEFLGVVRHVAVGAPVPQVLAGCAVEYDHSPIAIAVRDVGFVGLRVDPDARWTSEQRGIAAASGLLVLPERHQPLAVARELHDAVPVVAADPDVILMIDEDAVRLARPLGEIVHRPLTPTLHQLALLVEFEDGRCRLTAGAHRRRLLFVELFFGQRLRQVRHPHVLLRIHEDAGDRAHDPVVRHLERPGRVDLERGHARRLTADA